MSISKEQLKKAIKQVWLRSLTEIPPDVLAALEEAEARESDPRGKKCLSLLIESAKTAGAGRTVICQDTGLPTFFVRVPLDFPYKDDLRTPFDDAFRDFMAGEFPTRSMVVHPLTQSDRGDNTAANVPLIYTEVDNGIEYMEIKAMPTSAGPASCDAFTLMPASVGLAGVKKFVADTVVASGAKPCPPIIVGVGIGGPMEETARLAVKASARPIRQRHPEPDIAALEQELLEALNLSRIGPMGLGGDTSVLAVNIEYSGVLRPWMPVAVDFKCWIGHQASCRIYRDGRVEQI